MCGKHSPIEICEKCYRKLDKEAKENKKVFDEASERMGVLLGESEKISLLKNKNFDEWWEKYKKTEIIVKMSMRTWNIITGVLAKKDQLYILKNCEVCEIKGESKK